VRLVVLGGSGASTPELFDALRAWPGGDARRPPLEVTLVGRSRSKLELVASAARLRVAKVPNFRLATSTDRAAALAGADVVLNQVRIGGLDAREFDETYPRRHGLPGEETMGPGGFANALRTVPALRPAWEDVARIASEALVVNLTNPAGIVVQAARREFGLDVVEVCDSPISLCAAVAHAYAMPEGAARRRYLGMNHVGWWIPADGDTATPIASLANGVTPGVVDAYQALPGPYVRYYASPGRVAREQADGPPRAAVLRGLEAAILSAYGRGTADAPPRGAPWYRLAVVPLLDAWTNGSDEPLIAGRPSSDPRLPPDSVVESAWIVRSRRFRLAGDPPSLPALPQAILELHAAYERLVVDAILAGSPKGALVRALAANPMVRDVEVATELVEDVLATSP
jgi:6-phospho-beta-glucosidase